MTVTDLRLSFKMDTAKDPLWGKTRDGEDTYDTSWQRGWPRSIYGEWLEEKIGKPKYLRDRFFKVTGEIPTSSYFGDHSRKKEVIYKDYIEWLEEFVLRFYRHIITEIIGVE